MMVNTFLHLSYFCGQLIQWLLKSHQLKAFTSPSWIKSSPWTTTAKSNHYNNHPHHVRKNITDELWHQNLPRFWAHWKTLTPRNTCKVFSKLQIYKFIQVPESPSLGICHIYPQGTPSSIFVSKDILPLPPSEACRCGWKVWISGCEFQWADGKKNGEKTSKRINIMDTVWILSTSINTNSSIHMTNTNICLIYLYDTHLSKNSSFMEIGGCFHRLERTRDLHLFQIHSPGKVHRPPGILLAQCSPCSPCSCRCEKWGELHFQARTSIHWTLGMSKRPDRLPCSWDPRMQPLSANFRCRDSFLQHALRSPQAQNGEHGEAGDHSSDTWRILCSTYS